MFYRGTLQEGISTAVGQQKLVLCFVTNDNDESQTWEHEYLQDSSLSKLMETQAVALRLMAGSEEAGYLSQIFPLPKTPTVVVMKHGELKEYIAAGTGKDDFLRRILVAFNAAPPAPAPPSSSPPSTASSPSSSPTRPSAPVPAPVPPVAPAAAAVAAPATTTSRLPSPPPSSQTPPSQAQAQAQPPASAQAAAQSEIVGRILAERAAKLRAQKEEAERRAKEERAKAQEKAKAGADPGGSRIHRQAEELKKKRQAEQEERRRILKRIEDDRQERRMRASEKEQQRIERSQRAGHAAASPLDAQQATKLPSTTVLSEMASIQVRLFDGSTIRYRFKTASPLREVRRWVDENGGESKTPYTFKQVLTPLPNKNIDVTEEGKALGELGLAPSSTLVLIPVQKYSSAYGGAGRRESVLSRFVALVLGFLSWLLSLVGLAGGEQREAAGGERRRERPWGPDATARAASEESGRRVRGLQSLADAQRDHQLYNGNSLNFEPRPDDDET
ncbi:hypothetical protein Trco_003605 [Trichoderma cornu-damae]|uniref:UBX domain-containing protein 2 n=1 Tax=Trichoderma cornu-damae TaxID=654480 RepID=A0A9P8QRH9_9HYPO|nr:hypothetical protein Trco_003605 [Trichoderma cornu-damae]